MNPPGAAARSVTSYIEVFDEVICWGQERGLDGDWSKLQRRLDKLSQRIRDSDDDRARSPDWAYNLEREQWIEVLSEVLLPGVRDDLVKALRSNRGRGNADPGVWVALDPERLEAARGRHRRRGASAEAAVLAALKRHARRSSHVRIFEGLRALEELHDARMCLSPWFQAEVLVSEGKYLAETLRSLLPPTARRLLSLTVEDCVRSEIEGVPFDRLGPAKFFWHHKVPDLGLWYPMWTALSSDAKGPDPPGSWFVPSCQAAYERWKLEAERVNEAEQEKRVGRAMTAEEELQECEEAAPREQADVRTQGQVRGQRIQIEEAHGIGEEVEISVESKIKAWCERKGVSPKALTDETRAKLAREL